MRLSCVDFLVAYLHAILMFVPQAAGPNGFHRLLPTQLSCTPQLSSYYYDETEERGLDAIRISRTTVLF